MSDTYIWQNLGKNKFEDYTTMWAVRHIFCHSHFVNTLALSSFWSRLYRNVSFLKALKLEELGVKFQEQIEMYFNQTMTYSESKNPLEAWSRWRFENKPCYQENASSITPQEIWSASLCQPRERLTQTKLGDMWTTSTFVLQPKAWPHSQNITSFKLDGVTVKKLTDLFRVSMWNHGSVPQLWWMKGFHLTVCISAGEPQCRKNLASNSFLAPTSPSHPHQLG